MKWRVHQWARTPFPLVPHGGGSVLAVKGSLRRFAPWTDPGRSEGMTVYEGKGGVRAEGCGGRVATRHLEGLRPPGVGRAPGGSSDLPFERPLRIKPPASNGMSLSG